MFLRILSLIAFLLFAKITFANDRIFTENNSSFSVNSSSSKFNSKAKITTNVWFIEETQENNDDLTLDLPVSNQSFAFKIICQHSFTYLKLANYPFGFKSPPLFLLNGSFLI